MQELLANADNQKFDIDVALDQQLGAQPLPFPGMDKSGSAICTFYLLSVCNKGQACPFRHVKGDRSVVCKHWLRGLCKKGDDCEFLHEYDMSKMPECYFFSKFGLCSNKECPFLHIDPEKKIKDCAWYDRGFCRHGPLCKNRHIRRIICQSYLSGFCLDGTKCKFMHPQFDIPPPDPDAQAKKARITCHYCGEAGHKAINCQKMSGSQGSTGEGMPHRGGFGNYRGGHHGGGNMDPRRPLVDVTCYKCGEKGHYANRCPKGYIAFLSLSSTADHRNNEHQQE